MAIRSFLFTDRRASLIWLIVRLYLAWQWFEATREKIFSPAWTGSNAGVAVKGFLSGALGKAGGPHPDVSGWYGYFIQHVALPNATIFSYLVAYGELLVAIGLVLGACTALAAFFGAFLNMNFLLAGTVSANPTMLLLEILLICASPIAGYYGLDRWLQKIWRRSY